METENTMKTWSFKNIQIKNLRGSYAIQKQEPLSYMNEHNKGTYMNKIIHVNQVENCSIGGLLHYPNRLCTERNVGTV